MRHNSITILYGSETGTSELLSNSLSTYLTNSLSIRVKLSSFKPYTIERLSRESIALLLISTCGQGELPESMKSFWKSALKKNINTNLLENLKFSIFGLGDSSYVSFNYAAKKVHRRLLQLGAQEILPRFFADDQHPKGVYQEYDKWFNSIQKKLVEIFSIPYKDLNQKIESNIPPSLKITFGSSQTTNLNTIKESSLTTESTSPSDISEDRKPNYLLYSYNSPFQSSLLQNNRITDREWTQDVRNISFSIKNSNILYLPGDIVCIQPENDSNEVNSLLERLKINANLMVLSIESNDQNPLGVIKDVEEEIVNSQTETITLIDQSLSFPCSIFEVFQKVFDLSRPISPQGFRVLSYFTESDLERERLIEFSEAENLDQYLEYNIRERRSILEVLTDFPGINIPIHRLDSFFDILSRIQPRQFSISSSQMKYPDEIHITLAVVKWKTPFKRVRHGLCSRWLSSLSPESNPKIRLWIKEGTMRAPKKNVPFIMVGPGTGCAVFHAYIQEREQIFLRSPNLKKDSSHWLFFFGCRHESKDFLYRSELENYFRQNVISLLSIAFSRDVSSFYLVSPSLSDIHFQSSNQSSGGEKSKHYVQEDLIKFKNIIRSLILEKNGYFYLSGNSQRMPQDVRESLERIFEEGNYDGKETLKELQRIKHYQEETWF